MAITTYDSLIAAMIQGGYRYSCNKSSITAVTGNEMSLWRATGLPTQGNIPAASEICTNATVGAVPLAVRTGTQDRILAKVVANLGYTGHTLLIEDRLMQMGGLSGTVTTAQTVNLNLYNNLGTSNLSQRIGASDYSELDWYMEWYSATGATTVTPVFNVTFVDGTTGTANVNVFGSTVLPASVGASTRYKIYSTNGKAIRSIESVTLSASTGTAGNFGVTVVRNLAEISCYTTRIPVVADWSYLTAPKIFDNACIAFGQICATTSTGGTIVSLKQAVA
jgi:hypothetical protein